MSYPPSDIVYAYCRSKNGRHVRRVRLTDALPWDEAQSHWDALDRVRRNGLNPRVAIGLAGWTVGHYCVRSAADPTWPRNGRKHPVVYV